MGTKPVGAAVTARKQARERIAAVAKANRDREHLDAADLEQVLKAGAAVARAAAKRDTAVAGARESYAAAVAAVEAEQAAALARMKARGADDTALAALTGFDVGEVRRLLRLAAPAPVRAVAAAPSSAPIPASE